MRDFLPLAHHTPGALESMVEQARLYTEAHHGDNQELWDRSLFEIKVSPRAALSCLGTMPCWPVMCGEHTDKWAYH